MHGNPKGHKDELVLLKLEDQFPKMNNKISDKDISGATTTEKSEMSHIFGQRVGLVDKREVLALEHLLHIVVETIQ